MTTSRIRYVLYANAAFSGFGATCLLLAGSVIQDFLFDMPTLVRLCLGLGLALFALDVGLMAQRGVPSRGRLVYLVAADLAWVLLTPPAMLLFADRITFLGHLVLLDIALVVALFAFLEWRALQLPGVPR